MPLARYDTGARLSECDAAFGESTLGRPRHEPVFLRQLSILRRDSDGARHQPCCDGRAVPA